MNPVGFPTTVFPSMVPFNVPPLSWIRYKTAPTQFADRKNAPGRNYDEVPEGFVANDEPATTLAPEEVTEGDLKQRIAVIGDDRLTDAVRTALEKRLEKGSLEVQELPKQE